MGYPCIIVYIVTKEGILTSGLWYATRLTPLPTNTRYNFFSICFSNFCHSRSKIVIKSFTCSDFFILM